VFETALEKLWSHGGAIVDASDNVSRGGVEWRDSYLAQSEQKQTQIENMIRYAQSNHCRMSSLVRHFGDLADGLKPCGICDFCSPESCIAQQFRPATPMEQAVAEDVLQALMTSGRSVGKLHAEVCGSRSLNRDEFEEVVGAMARAGLVRLHDEVFEKDGKTIPFRKVTSTRDAEIVELTIRDRGAPVRGRQGTKKRKTAKKKAEPREAVRPQAEQPLRAWRAGLAKRQGVPAFRIMSDKVLVAIAERRPKTAAELLAIPGIGIKAVEKYGAQIYRILNQARA
jgi:superfamily II DNA helicase RecQ